jgi:hypothetical protein
MKNIGDRTQSSQIDIHSLQQKVNV